MELLLPVVVFGAVISLVAGIAILTRPRAAGQRLSQLGGAAATASLSGNESMLVGDDSGWLSRILARLGSRSVETADLGPLRKRLVHAGFRRRNAPALYFGMRIALAISVPAVLILVPTVWNLPYFQLLAALCMGAGLGYIAPSVYVDKRLNSRRGQLERSLPDALDLMVVCVEAGFGINAALARVSEEFEAKSPILSQEVAMVSHETRAGKSTTDALRGLAERTGVNDISALVALLVQTERFGTSVANALRVHADAMRIRRMQRAEERAQKAPLKLIFPSTLIFAALLLLFLAPSLSRFMGAFPDA
jgi:tight adherence protein C